MDKIDVEKIKESANIADIISRYIQLKQDGTEFRACCPFHEEKTPSFTVVPNKGFYHCFGCGAHGDVIDFVTEFTGASFKEAIESLGGKIDSDAPVPIKTQRVNPYDKYTPKTGGFAIRPGMRVELINPKRDGTRWTVTPVAVYPYNSGYVLRIEVEGKKITPMIRWCDGPQGTGWHIYPFDSPRPLYGYRNDTKQVLVVEGEKCADRGRTLSEGKLEVVTWAGGSNAVDKTDWSVLENRKVLIWPDNDAPGFAAAQKIYDLISPIAQTCDFILPPQGKPEGWDIADGGWHNSSEFFAFCKANKSSRLPGQKQSPKPTESSKPYAKPKPTEKPKTTPQGRTNGNAAIKDEPKPQNDNVVPFHHGPSFSAGSGGEDWRTKLIQDDKGQLKSNVNNALLLLTHHDDMAGVFRFNEFSKSVDVVKRPPWCNRGRDYPRATEDNDDTNATAWLESRGVKLNISTTHSCIRSAASENPYNPLQDYLNSLEWDGAQRIDMALHRMLGVEDNEYSRAVSRKFLIGSVARALKPGCKMDTMLILEGPQGLKKSTAVNALYGDDWFTDELSDFGSKDAALQVQGRWCVEVSELSALSRTEVKRAKEWIARQSDKFRPPYGRNIVTAPRQCVLVGTVNPEGGYLKDATGGRRFWPVKCKKINIKLIKEFRDQIWAEAVQAFKKGEKWWLSESESRVAEQEQEQRYESDAWEDAVTGYVKNKINVTISDVMTVCLDLSSSNQTQLAQNRVAKILVSNGWERSQRRVDGRRQWIYENPEFKNF